MNARLSAALFALAIGSALGCSNELLTQALGEPVRVTYGDRFSSAQFLSGPLPGTRPLNADEVNAGVKPTPPNISSGPELTGLVVGQLETGKVISGSASASTVAIGARFADLGSGYWVFPVGSQDLVAGTDFTWRAQLAFGGNIPPGQHPLTFAAIAADGHAGTQSAVGLCVLGDIPDNLNACDPRRAPPATVASLHWDAAVDLDLRVVTPSGKVVDGKHPSTALAPDGGVIDPTLPGTGVLDRDSLRACVSDGYRREDLVWQDKPSAGTYSVYANLYDACGQSSVRFTFSLNQPGPGADAGTETLSTTFERSGVLLAMDANAGSKLGMFVTEFVVQ
jgi:hypothetical protein